MKTLEPTCTFRWLVKHAGKCTMHDQSGIIHNERQAKILQQYWRDLNSPDGEWKNIPMVMHEEEEK